VPADELEKLRREFLKLTAKERANIAKTMLESAAKV